jgi:hypothetical protein
VEGGALTGSATLFANVLNGTPSLSVVSLSGTGLGQGSQTITFPPLGSQTAGKTVGLVATASSGLPVIFASLTPTVCSVSGSTATLIASGSCTIQASQAGNTGYAPATPVSQSFVVSAALQTITFNAIPSQPAGGSVTLSASASSGLTVSFATLTPTVCTVSGSAATLLTAGTCTIQATQPGNAVYEAATPVDQSFTVTQTASFTITPIPAVEKVYRGTIGGFILVLKSVQGFDGKVKVSCSGGPAGSTCVDFPQTVTLKGTAYVVSGIFIPKNATPGSYTVNFTGVSGTIAETATATFIVK